MSEGTYSMEGTAWKPIQTSHLKWYRFNISSSIIDRTFAPSSTSHPITSFARALSPLRTVLRFARPEAVSGGRTRGRTRKWNIDLG